MVFTVGTAALVLGIETKGRTIENIEEDLATLLSAPQAATPALKS